MVRGGSGGGDLSDAYVGGANDPGIRGGGWESVTFERRSRSGVKCFRHLAFAAPTGCCARAHRCRSRTVESPSVLATCVPLAGG
jgi:hypothetical protein